MPFDGHIHIGSKGEGSIEERVARLLAKLDRHGVDGAVVLPLDGLFSGFVDHRADNDFIHTFCSHAPQRLKPACSVNPMLGAAAVDEIRRCHDELGVKTLKLHPWLHGCSLANPESDAVAAICAELDMALLSHDGTPPYTSPLQLARFAREYPQLRVVSGHAGLNDLWPDAIAAAKRYPNFYLCMCGVPFHVMQNIVAQVPLEQVCVGSDLFENLEDLVWYRWAIWRSVELLARGRTIIEEESPCRIFGNWSPGVQGRAHS